MLIPDNIHPKNSIYYNGALILETLYKENNIEFLELYIKIKEMYTVSFRVFILCMDWLYLAEIAKIENGRVKLCF